MTWPCELSANTKPARATPITSATASTAATGAIGIGRAGRQSRPTGRLWRLWRPAREEATPYQARALMIPARPATGTAHPGDSRPITTAARESTRKSARSHSAERSGGRVRHHPLVAAPWLSSRANRISIGSAPRNGQENGSRATPNVSVTTGDISRPALRVRTAPEATKIAGRGRACPPGQASQARAASSKLRATTRPARASAKRGQVPPNANSHRRSWNTASGASAVTWGASTRADGVTAFTAAASAIGTAAATTIRPGRRVNPRPRAGYARSLPGAAASQQPADRRQDQRSARKTRITLRGVS